MKKLRTGEWFGLLFALAVVYVLVRPSSAAAQLVDLVGRTGVAIVRRATDTANV